MLTLRTRDVRVLLPAIGAVVVLTTTLVASAGSVLAVPFAVWSLTPYLALYFVFGALNYTLVTKPYYDTHAGGLTAPDPGVVLAAELVRAPLIVFSVLLFLLSVRGTRRQLMVKTGWLLFAIGGIVPLVLQVSALPILLLAASAIEIFLQNFFTGAAAARLMGIEDG